MGCSAPNYSAYSMRTRLDLEIAACFFPVEIIRQSAFDVARLGVVALDQVRVITVHHPHGVGEIGRGLGMQPMAEPFRRSGQAGNAIGDLDRNGVKQAGLDT